MSKQSVISAQQVYESALARYEAFRKVNDAVFEEHDLLASALAETLEAFKYELKQNHQIVGKVYAGFKVTVPKKFDPDALIEALGLADAKAYLEEEIKYTVDKDAFNKACAAGRIPSDVADKVIVDQTPRVSGGVTPPTPYVK